MPWCPQCGTEYRPGFTECADCHVPLSDEPHAAPRAPVCDAPTDPVPVYEAATSMDGEMICEALRNAGIPAALRDREPGQITKVYLGSSVYGVTVLVDRTRIADAHEVLTVWAAQDDRAPIDEETLAQLALGSLSEDELARQAQSAPPQPARFNRAFYLTAAALVLLLVFVLALLLPLLR